jgi:hypothetical protein
MLVITFTPTQDAQALNATILKTLDSDGFTVGSGDLNTNTGSDSRMELESWWHTNRR